MFCSHSPQDPCFLRVMHVFPLNIDDPGYFDLGQVEPIFVAQVGSAIFGLGFGKFCLKIPKFQYFSLWIKKNLARLSQKVPELETGRPLIYCGSKVCLDWAHL